MFKNRKPQYTYKDSQDNFNYKEEQLIQEQQIEKDKSDVSIYDIKFKSSNNKKDLLVSLLNSYIYNNETNFIYEAIEEETNKIVLPYIDNKIINNLINKTCEYNNDSYLKTLGSNNEIMVFEEAILNYSILENSDIALLVVKKLNNNQQIFNNSFNEFSNYISEKAVDVLMGGREINNPNELYNEIINTEPDIEIDDIEVLGSAVLANETIALNNMKGMKRNIDLCGQIIPADQLIKAIILDLYNLFIANTANKFTSYVQSINLFLTNLKGVLIALQTSNIVSILGALSQYTNAFNNIGGIVYMLKNGQWLDLLINTNAPLNQVGKIINEININNFPNTTNVIKNILFESNTNLGNLLNKQKELLMKKIHMSDLIKDVGINAKNLFGSFCDTNSLIKAIDIIQKEISNIVNAIFADGIYNKIDQQIFETRTLKQLIVSNIEEKRKEANAELYDRIS